MAKIIIAADIHLGYRGKLDDCIWALNAMSDYGKKNNIDTIIIMGDIFHDRVNLNIEVIHKTLEFFEDAKETGQNWIIFPGNHDMFLRNSWKINSLCGLKHITTLINDISRIQINGGKFVVVPFMQSEKVYMDVISRLSDSYEDGDVLLTHIGVVGAKLNECFLLKNWGLISFEYTPFDLVFTGHFHCAQQLGKVNYPGSPIPFNFAEGMSDHGFIVYDMDTRDIQNINIMDLGIPNNPPDYCSVSLDADAAVIEGNHIRVMLEEDVSDASLAEIKRKMKEKGAKSVRIIKLKEQIDLAEHSEHVTISPPKLFETWLKSIKLDQSINEKLLLTLNKQIIMDTVTNEE